MRLDRESSLRILCESNVQTIVLTDLGRDVVARLRDIEFLMSPER